MTEFKKFIASSLHKKNLPDASVSVTGKGITLYLDLDSRDNIVAASYEGPTDVWMSSLCEIIQDMPLAQARMMDFSYWELAWKDDQYFWDLKLESGDELFFTPLELLHSALDIYRGREFLYKDESPLICRCFGVREDDVLSFLKTAKEVTLEELSKETKAGMGCRSCVSQLKQWLLINSPKSKTRFFKSRPVADWIEMIDTALARFPEAPSWKMNVESMKQNVVIISYDFDCSQKVEEETGKRLQGFLAGALDSDLAFFLRRARQRSNALG